MGCQGSVVSASGNRTAKGTIRERSIILQTRWVSLMVIADGSIRRACTGQGRKPDVISTGTLPHDSRSHANRVAAARRESQAVVRAWRCCVRRRLDSPTDARSAGPGDAGCKQIGQFSLTPPSPASTWVLLTKSRLAGEGERAMRWRDRHRLDSPIHVRSAGSVVAGADDAPGPICRPPSGRRAPSGAPCRRGASVRPSAG